MHHAWTVGAADSAGPGDPVSPSGPEWLVAALGAGGGAWLLARALVVRRLVITTDRPAYAPGDVMRVSVTSRGRPLVGPVAMTLTCERVHLHLCDGPGPGVVDRLYEYRVRVDPREGRAATRMAIPDLDAGGAAARGRREWSVCAHEVGRSGGRRRGRVVSRARRPRPTRGPVV
jgi:hypothetical protein